MDLMQVFWKRRALADLDRIATHIAENDRQAARNVVRRLHEAVALLKVQPRAGRIGRLEGTRELVISSLPYILAYLIGANGKELEILAVFHDRQKWPDTPIK